MSLAHVVPTFATRGLSGYTVEETDWWRKWEHLKTNSRIDKGCTVSQQAAVHLEHMPQAWTKKKKNSLIAPILKVKVKFYLSLQLMHMGGSKGAVPLILNFGTR